MNTGTDNWPAVTLRIQPTGKAPVKYGSDVWRFSSPFTLSVLLPKRGWLLIKKTSRYVYLKPPLGLAKSDFQITIQIPSKDQVLVYAREQRLHGTSWMGQLGEWSAWFDLGQATTLTEVLSGDRDLVSRPATIIDIPAVPYFHIGEFGVWSADVRWTEDGEKYYEYRDNIVDYGSEGGSEDMLPGTLEHLHEGRSLTVEMTTYERNPEARRRCLAHFGSACQACGFDFERTYGILGHGFIHVHHIVPLSEIGEQYVVNPIDDLVPVCPNCHAMLHRRLPPYSVAELKALLRSSSI